MSFDQWLGAVVDRSGRLHACPCPLMDKRLETIPRQGSGQGLWHNDPPGAFFLRSQMQWSARRPIRVQIVELFRQERDGHGFPYGQTLQSDRG